VTRTHNPELIPRRAKYDGQLFHQYNWGVRKAIRAYDEDQAIANGKAQRIDGRVRYPNVPSVQELDPAGQ
jgi:hypothetical protein